MARRTRLDLQDVPQHIIQRGVNRAAAFYADSDYRFYLRWMETSLGLMRPRSLPCRPDPAMIGYW
ncbi:MAG TPA: hypothetical protein VLN59_18425 [Burkholderiales bacterium]|nr:hypothetical protein [Burkholderiales bacterium]